MKKIPYTKAFITNQDIKSVNNAIKTGWGKKHNFFIKKFERNFKKKFKTKYAIATSSCTGALMISLMSLGIKKGDEVILADTNWISPAACVKQLGGICKLVDIDPINWCISPVEIKKNITKKTKAIIVTHLYGNLCEMKKILGIGKKFDIPILEDAAEAIGSKYNKKFAGTFGDLGVFSFHGTKTITTGEGGMIVTNKKRLYEKALLISNQGRPENKMSEFRPIVDGVKFKMSNLQAALGISQIKRLDSIVKKKISIFENYKKKLKHYNDISLNFNAKGNVNSYWMPTIIFSKKSKVKKASIIKNFKENNIDARPFFVPISSLKMFKSKKNLNSYDIYKRAINLPSYLAISNKEIDRVCKVIKSLLKI